METLAYPLQVNTIRRNSKHNTFGMVRNNHHRAHQGWDLLATPLTPCYAIADGRIARVRISPDYGRHLLLQFEFRGKTYFAAYCHLSIVDVIENDQVARGDLICRTGNSGNAKSMRGANQHLHFEIRTVELPGRSLAGHVDPELLYGGHLLHHTVYQHHHADTTEVATRPGFKVPGVNVLD